VRGEQVPERARRVVVVGQPPRADERHLRPAGLADPGEVRPARGVELDRGDGDAEQAAAEQREDVGRPVGRAASHRGQPVREREPLRPELTGCARGDCRRRRRRDEDAQLRLGHELLRERAGEEVGDHSAASPSASTS
jgi:hypothetical protein